MNQPNSKTRIRPLGRRVLLFLPPHEIHKKLESGLFIPVKKDDELKRAIVMGIGEEVEGLKIDDVVIYDDYAGVAINQDQDTYLIIFEEDIIAIDIY